MRCLHRCQLDIILTACAILLNSVEKDVNSGKDELKKIKRKKEKRKKVRKKEKKEINKKYLQDPAGGRGRRRGVGGGAEIEKKKKPPEK